MKMNTNTFEEVKAIKEDFETKAEVVRTSKFLNRAGQADAIEKLTSEKKAALAKLIPPLRRAAVLDALEVAHFERVKGTLKSLESEHLDWQRLQYDSTRVKSSLVLCEGDPQKIMEKWKQAKESRDRYFIRAWLDTAPETFPANTGPDLAWLELKEDMAASGGAADSDEMLSYERQRLEKLASLEETKRAALAIANDFGASAGYEGQAVMNRVFEGFGPDSETGEFKLDVEANPYESSEAVYARLESEHAAEITQQAEFFKDKGYAYDPLSDFVERD
jgi:hypothetical protein